MITKLSINKINELIKESKIQFISLKETENGITDSTYLGTSRVGKQYIFKIFEESTIEDVRNKILILNNLTELKVPKILSTNIVLFENKPTILFSFIKGNIPKVISIDKINEIVNFLSKLHKVKDFIPSNKNIYSKIHFEKMTKNIQNENLKNEIIKKYSTIKDIDLKPNSIIHGDLFPDNSKFIEETLSGVYDFAQSCYGNKYFDLAVLIISWSFEEFEFKYSFFNKIIEIYEKNMDEKITKKQIKKYLLYACLYYSVQRITRKNNKKDYNEYLIKFDILNKIL